MLECRAAQPEVGIDIGLECDIELVIGDLIKCLFATLMSRVRDQDVKLAESLDRLLDDLIAESGNGKVPWQHKAVRTFRFHRAAGFLRVRLFLWQIGNRDIGALACVKHRHSAADAGVATGDQCRLPAQLVGGAVRGRLVLRPGLQFGLDTGAGLVLGRKRRLGMLRGAIRT